jgi:hypothetical protein
VIADRPHRNRSPHTDAIARMSGQRGVRPSIGLRRTAVRAQRR